MEVPTLSLESHTDTVDNDEEKIRILASMIPFVGIYLTEKYDHPLMRRGRIISSTVVFIFLFSLLFSSSEGIVGFLIMTLGILIFVVE